MTDLGGPYSRPSSAAAYSGQPPLHTPSPHPSVASRGSRSSLRRQAAIAAGSASASASASATASIQQQQSQTQTQQPIPEQQQQPPDPTPLKFTQLFTTVTSTAHPSAKSSTHHPTVHYIFADDDPEILTEALARHHRVPGDEEDDEDEPPPAALADTRAVVLDLVPSPSTPAGYSVSWASSLSPDWAVVNATVGRTDSSALQAGGGAGMLTLHIEGVTVEPPAASTPVSSRISGVGTEGKAKDKADDGGDPSEEYPGLLEEFDKRMEVLRRVVEAAEGRRRAVEAAAAEQDDEMEEGDETQMPEEGEDDEETQRPDYNEGLGEGAGRRSMDKGKEREGGRGLERGRGQEDEGEESD